MHPIFDFQRSRQIQCHPHPPKQCNTPPLFFLFFFFFLFLFPSPSPLLPPRLSLSALPCPFLPLLASLHQARFFPLFHPPHPPSLSLSAPRSFLSPLFISPGAHSSCFSLTGFFSRSYLPHAFSRCLLPLSFTTSPQTCSVLFSALPTLSFRPALFSSLYFSHSHPIPPPLTWLFTEPLASLF